MHQQTEFIDLDRHFHRLDRKQKFEEAAYNSYTRPLLSSGMELTWVDLEKESLVVVLGEPGSGKTWEFRNRAKVLSKDGFGFFVQLDRLASDTFRNVLGGENHTRFELWRRGNKHATFFLDSVDEAKFHKPSDFYAALDKFCDALGAHSLRRARIFLSSRISEWQPSLDAEALLRRFSQPQAGKSSQPDQESQRPAEKLLVVQIEPLDEARVEIFVKARGISDSRAFLDALDAHHAWEFVRRPIDIVDLGEYWGANGKLGTLTELLEFTTERKLRPSQRDSRDPLQPVQARLGAEALGAATSLCRQFAFKVPDESFLEAQALDVYACLPNDWQKDHCKALLTRPIFDGASYGRIRFHHRRIAEYLAARWFEARVKNGLPVNELEELLFKQIRNRRVVRPALAPCAAWLCSGSDPWNEDVRRWVLESDPSLHLQYGDPQTLPLEYKRRVLQALIRLSEGRKYIGIDSSKDSLSRLSDPALADDIVAVIRDNKLAVDLREEMIQIVRYGKLQVCLTTLLDIIASPDEPDRLKTYAAAAIRDMGDEASRAALFNIASQLTQVENRLCGIICEALYPRTIDAAKLIKLLRKTNDVPLYSVDVPYFLESHFKSNLKPEQAGDLLVHLVTLGQTAPHLSENSPISQQFYWVGSVLPTALKILLSKSKLTDLETETAANALWYLGHSDRTDRVHDEHDNKELDQLTMRHSSVRQHYVWRLIDEKRTRSGKEPGNFFDIFDHFAVFHPELVDVEWLLRDIKGRDEIKDQTLCLRLAIGLWDGAGRPRGILKQIRVAIHHSAALRLIFQESIRNWWWIFIRRTWNRYPGRLQDRWWWEHKLRHVRHYWRNFRTHLRLLRSIRDLSQGKAVRLLAKLVLEVSDQHNWAPLTWRPLQLKRGKLVASAVKKGCKASWRSFLPSLPHEQAELDARLIAGLAGLQAAIVDGDLDLRDLDGEDANRAVRYAINEQNGFAPWLPKLSESRRDVVGTVLSECVRGEWQFKADKENVYEVMNDLVWQGASLSPLVEKTVWSLLLLSDPPNIKILEWALIILLRNDQLHAPLDTLAAKRVQGLSPDSSAFNLWLGIWFQINASAALDFLENLLSQGTNTDKIVMRLCAALSGRRSEKLRVETEPSYRAPLNLRRLVPLVYRHIKVSEDIQRAGTGGYSPEDRDEAQDFRNGLLVGLSKNETQQAADVLDELMNEPILSAQRDWIHHLRDQQVKGLANLVPWGTIDVRKFAIEHEIDPKTAHDLFKIACKRCVDIKREVEQSENSLRSEMHSTNEGSLRQWIARKLQERSRDRYTVPQEAVIDQDQRPDLRLENPKTDAVCMEVKWTDSWSTSQLLERLENQLIGQYLRAHNANFGIYFLGRLEKKNWEHPDTGEQLDFQQLTELLKKRAENLSSGSRKFDAITVIAVDFLNPK